VPSSPFALAFQETLKSPVERRILVTLLQAGHELRYEEVRRAISTEGPVAPQTFRNAVERLSARAAIDRRLEPQGDRHLSYLAPTRRGRLIAEVLAELARAGTIPRSLPDAVQRDLQAVFLGDVSAAT
jgi:hypothetical protein